MADNNYPAGNFSDVSGLTLSNLVIDPRSEGLDPSAYDDLFKLSHVTDTQVYNLTVDGGGLQRENAIDLNRECRDILIEGAKVVGGRQNVLTIKGGCYSVHVKNLEILRPGGNCDVELGNHSDQSKRKTTRTTLENVWRTDGKPVRLRVGNADWPRIIGGNVKIDYVGSYRLKIWLFFKSL